MEVEYLTFTTYSDQLKDRLNGLTKDGWVLHTVLDWGDGMLYVVMEGAVAPQQEPEPEPMRMKGYVNT